MQILKKWELQQTAFDHPSNIDFKDLSQSLQKMPCQTVLFLVIDTTLASDNALCLRKNPLDRVKKLIMTIDDKIRAEKVQCDVAREAAKISELSSDKVEKYKYLMNKEIVPPDQSRIIGQGKFTYSF